MNDKRYIVHIYAPDSKTLEARIEEREGDDKKAIKVDKVIPVLKKVDEIWTRQFADDAIIIARRRTI